MSVAIFGMVRSWAADLGRPRAAERRVNTLREISTKRLDWLGGLVGEAGWK